MIPAAIETMKATSTTLLIERARLDGVLMALCEVGGFPMTVAAVQSALQRLAAEQRAAGELPEGWIG